MSSSVDLSGKVVLVTGASRGIGNAVALAAAVAGAETIITGRTIGALEELDDAIKALGAHAIIVEHDMNDFDAMPRLASAVCFKSSCNHHHYYYYYYYYHCY